VAALDRRGGECRWPHGTIHRDKDIDAIRIFGPVLKRVLAITRGRNSDDRLNRPEGVAVAGRRVWLYDTYNNRVLSLDTGS